MLLSFVFTMQFGEIPIMHAAREGQRDLVEVIFPHTKPIASLPNWSVDGIITTVKYMPSKVYVLNWSLYFIIACFYWCLIIFPYL
jgi:hypothetical protein